MKHPVKVCVESFESATQNGRTVMELRGIAFPWSSYLFLHRPFCEKNYVIFSCKQMFYPNSVIFEEPKAI